MIILLDIDGVLETTPIWRPVEIHSDGFMKLNESALENLSILCEKTNASIVLTTTHRIKYDEIKWKAIFQSRGVSINALSKINDKSEMSEMLDRGSEIKEWVETKGIDQNYVIIDDDLSINALSEEIKERWVATKLLIGFDKAALEQALQILIPRS
jgi:hypothetical protein